MIPWLLSPFGLITFAATFVLTVLSRLRYGIRMQISIVVAGALVLVGSYHVVSIPLPASIDLPAASSVYDDNGELIGTYSEVSRFLIDARTLPRHVLDAVVAAEDRDFYEHRGLSIKGMLRAAWANLKNLRISQGGSTIDQQYVKIAVLRDSSRRIVRKIKEAVLAVKLNRVHSKDEILGFYLNTIYLGSGAYGIEAAARTYFRKSARDLSLGEAAYLAGIIRAPEAYQPDENGAGAARRRDAVLQAMVAERFITAGQARRAGKGPVSYARGLEQRSRTQRAAYFMEWLRKNYLDPQLGECLYTCGLKVHTTLDLGLQAFAEDSVARYLPRDNDPQAAMVAMTPEGEVRAFVGGRPFNDVKSARGFNYAADYPGRAAGSTLKPFTLLAALQDGISPHSTYSGASPTTIHDPSCADQGEEWKVENYGYQSFGGVSLDAATSASVNTVYAQLIARVGPAKVARLLERLGFSRQGTSHQRTIEPYCSLALGALDVTPLEMTRSYAAFAGDGVLPPVQPIKYVLDAAGLCLKSYIHRYDNSCHESVAEDSTRLVERHDSRLMNQVLAHVIDQGTGTSARIGRPAAGKTGTTQNFSDAWFAGYVPQLAASVWVGYPIDKDAAVVPQMRPCSDKRLCRPVQGGQVTGGTIPAKIWGDFMRRATARLPIVGFVRSRPLSRVAHGDGGQVGGIAPVLAERRLGEPPANNIPSPRPTNQNRPLPIVIGPLPTPPP